MDINKGDNAGYTLLHWATQEAHLDVIQFLLESGADTNLQDENVFQHCT